MIFPPQICPATCNEKLIAGNKFGVNISVSSSVDVDHGPEQAAYMYGTTYWQAATSALTEWIQVSISIIVVKDMMLICPLCPDK